MSPSLAKAPENGQSAAHDTRSFSWLLVCDTGILRDIFHLLSQRYPIKSGVTTGLKHASANEKSHLPHAMKKLSKGLVWDVELCDTIT